MVALTVHDVGELDRQSLLLSHEPKDDRRIRFPLAGQLLFVILGCYHFVDLVHAVVDNIVT